MSRALWTGALRFGLVHVPVRLYGAVTSRPVPLHLLHDEDGARIQLQRICSADGQRVTPEHVVRGYEVRPGRYVEVTRGELEALHPGSSHTVELEDFVELVQIDPLYFDTTYHVMPDEEGWEAYAAVAAALRVSGRVGLGRLVMYGKGHLCALRPYGRGLVLSTLHYADTLVPQDSFEELLAPGPAPDEREIESALRMIEDRATPFEPQRYHDVHRERLLSFLERRARAQGLLRPPAETRAEPAAPPAPEAAAEEPPAAEETGSLRIQPEASPRQARQPPQRPRRTPRGDS
jgi:DNA end-binding protein Ku